MNLRTDYHQYLFSSGSLKKREQKIKKGTQKEDVSLCSKTQGE